MSRVIVPLNNSKLEKLEPHESQYLLADDGGFNLRIIPSGNKIWLSTILSSIAQNELI